MTSTKFSKEAERIFKSYGAIPHDKLENHFIIEKKFWEYVTLS